MKLHRDNFYIDKTRNIVAFTPCLMFRSRSKDLPPGIAIGFIFWTIGVTW